MEDIKNLSKKAKLTIEDIESLSQSLGFYIARNITDVIRSNDKISNRQQVIIDAVDKVNVKDQAWEPMAKELVEDIKRYVEGEPFEKFDQSQLESYESYQVRMSETLYEILSIN